MPTSQPNRRNFLEGVAGIGLGTSLGSFLAPPGECRAAETPEPKQARAPLRYEELRPAELDAAIKKLPVCYVPLGIIEWSGEHLPVGADGMRAKTIAERASELFGGIVYPTIYTGTSAEYGWNYERYNYNGSVAVTQGTLYILIRDIVSVLKQVGFRGVVLLSAHVAGEQISVLQRIAKECSDDHCSIWAGSESELSGGKPCERGGLGETSCMLYVRPELVRIESLKERDGVGIANDAEGRPEALRATAAVGKLIVEAAVDGIRKILTEWKLLA
jgi:creatinine amidohydrolase